MAENNDRIERTEQEQARAEKIHDNYRTELLKRQLSNTENYDKIVLTLSSAALPISISIWRFVADPETATGIKLMITAWGLLAGSIIISLLAYIISNKAIKKQLEIAHEYYINARASYADKQHLLSRLNTWLNYLVGALFSIAITLIVIYVSINLQPGTNTVSKKQDNAPQSILKESAQIPDMQHAVTGDTASNSAEIPTMESAPGSTSESQQPQSDAPASAPEKKE